ncbi:hypothetical protein EBU58_04945, partial [bacterium]|nr:hypothetical protein [bacterium]
MLLNSGALNTAVLNGSAGAGVLIDLAASPTCTASAAASAYRIRALAGAAVDVANVSAAASLTKSLAIGGHGTVGSYGYISLGFVVSSSVTTAASLAANVSLRFRLSGSASAAVTTFATLSRQILAANSAYVFAQATG